MRPWSRSGPRPRPGSSVKPSTALSKAGKDGTSPMRSRSSGTCSRPELRAAGAGLCSSGREIARPSSRIVPSTGWRMPASASSSSLWPLPATPAMPTISPAWTVKDTFATRSTPRWSTTERFSTSSSGAPGRRARTSRPAAGRAGRPSARRVPAARFARCPRVATISPRRMTETRSVTAMISRSLWVIRMTVLPCSLSGREQRRTGRRPPAASAPRSARRG